MPPKKPSELKQAKAELKKKEKVVEDKTFGLKNKNKSKRVQKEIKGIQTSVLQSAKKKLEKADNKTKEQREEEKKRAKDAELNLLFKSVQQAQEISGDPKTIVCEFFKKGLCKKGAKCRFSHDLEVGRKVQKINLYVDPRDPESQMTNWSQDQLESIVEQKFGESNQKNKTDIICKYFLDAVELRQYGYFWHCPNGADCFYKHCLPLGYKLTPASEKAKAVNEDEEEEMSLEEKLDLELNALRNSQKKLTAVTEESFAKWYSDQQKKRKEETRKKIQANKNKKQKLTGRELFSFDPNLFEVQCDDDEGVFDSAEREIYTEENAESAYNEAENYSDEEDENIDEADELSKQMDSGITLSPIDTES